MKGEDAIVTLFGALVIISTIAYIISGQPIFTEEV
tara:strand:+ start:5067 stop:5171 length:105 start_codon:yes stop_codon:yes gene_type:complete